MSVINQKEYLKKYLGIGKSSSEKKKKKKTKKSGSGLKIVDDDVDIRLNEEIQVDLTAENDEAPQIVSVIDDRPPSLRIDEETHSKLWKPIGVPDESDYVKKSIKFEGNIRLSKLGNKPTLLKSKRDPSSKQNKELLRKSPSRIHKEISSPLRQENFKTEKHSDVSSSQDFSPVRQHKSEDLSPSRRAKVQSSDNSPPRRKHTAESSPVRRRKGGDSPSSKSNLSPLRKNSDNSPFKNDKDISPRRIRTSDDNSPPRKRNVGDMSPPRRTRRADSDISPPRRIKTETRKDLEPSRKEKDAEEDSSPPRRIKRISEDNSLSRRRDQSPARKKSRWGNDEEISKKMEKTLDGKVAGLQNAAALVEETKELRKREDELFKKLGSEISGANAATVVRKKNKEIDLEEEERKRKADEENKEKYNRWGRGLKQVDDVNEKMRNDLYEMSKPLARYADDEDLEKHLKDQEREGDPMLAYIRQKKRKKAVDQGAPAIQQYQGDAPPNRFGIRPGYRWDGVDRSSGYEKKWFEVQNSRKASIEESYKWSTEDM